VLALQLLRQHRLTPKLQADISTALQVGRLKSCSSGSFEWQFRWTRDDLCHSM
jgi:hypothetical protein